jgi:hypothetical protein
MFQAHHHRFDRLPALPLSPTPPSQPDPMSSLLVPALFPTLAYAFSIVPPASGTVVIGSPFAANVVVPLSSCC